MQHQFNIENQTNFKKAAAVTNAPGNAALQLTDSNRKMIQQMKERQQKQSDTQKSRYAHGQQSTDNLQPFPGQPTASASKYSGSQQITPDHLHRQQLLLKNYKREQQMLPQTVQEAAAAALRKQVDIELPDSIRHVSQIDDQADQFMIQSSIEDGRCTTDNFLSNSNTLGPEQLEATPPKKSSNKKYNLIKQQQPSPQEAHKEEQPVMGDRELLNDGNAQKMLREQLRMAPYDSRQQQEDNDGLFGALDISPIESQDNLANSKDRVSMARGQLNNATRFQQQPGFQNPNRNDQQQLHPDIEAAQQAKRAKEFMSSLQDRLRNLKSNSGEAHFPEEAVSNKRENVNLNQLQHHDVQPVMDLKKMQDKQQQPTYQKNIDDQPNKNVILDVLELKLQTENAAIEKNKVMRKDTTQQKKANQSSSVGPKGDDKCSNSASSNSQKRKQSQPKQGEKGQGNAIGMPQHSSSDSSGGSQVELKEADRLGPNGKQLNPVLPYPNAQADAVAFLKGEKYVPSESHNQLDNHLPSKDDAKITRPLTSIQNNQKDKFYDHSQAQEIANKEIVHLNVPHTERAHADQLHKSQQDLKIDTFQPTTSGEIPAASVVENEFQSFFQEMNDKANDVMSMQQPEPEKALEFLKQVDDFVKKIQQAQKIMKEKQENDRKKHIRTEVNDTDRRSPKRISMADEKKTKDKNDIKRQSFEQSLTERGTQDKKSGLVSQDDDPQFQVSGNDFKNLMGLSPANMLGDDVDDDNFVYHTIYRTTPCSSTIGTIIVEEQHQNGMAQRSKTSLSAPKTRDGIEDSHQRSKAGTIIPKNQQTEMNQPYKIQYTVKQLAKIDIDPTFKVILFYNMACCCQRLHLNDECTQYLESSTKALQERIKLLEAQEQTLLHQNFNMNTVNILYAPSSRTSVKHGDEPIRDDKLSLVPQLLQSAELQNLNLRNKVSENRQKEIASVEMPVSQRQGSIYLQERNLSISQTRLSTSMVHQLQNFKYEKLLAQKMQSLRYQCKLHLQICAVLSQQGMHRDALIFGNKSSHLCYQLIKDAQLLCKRQMQQIRRQRQSMESESEDDEERAQEYQDSDQDEVYGEMGATIPALKRKQTAKDGDGSRQPDEQSINSYSVKSMKNKERKPRRHRNAKYKRTRSNSTQNNLQKHQNETVQQVNRKLEPLPQAQIKNISATPSTTQRNSPKKRRADQNNQIDGNSRKSHSSDSKHRNKIPKANDNRPHTDMETEALGQQKFNFALTQDRQLYHMQEAGREEANDGQNRNNWNSNNKRARSRNYQQSNNVRSCVSESNRTEQSSASFASQYSANSFARIKIKRAFDNQSKSSAGESGVSQVKIRNKFHARDNSVSSQMSQESLKKIYSFALKNAKSLHQLQKEQEQNEELAASKKEAKLKGADSKKEQLAKVYYVEEQVKVLSEIIQMADPILTELSSQIFQFEKLALRKITYKQRDIELYRRYGKEDFMAERDKLNISFRNLKEIKAIQQIKKFKIAVRNTLGLKQLDDWIYNLNIGNVMHLSLMSADELQPIENLSPQGGAKHSHMNSIGGATTNYRIQSALELDQASRDGAQGQLSKQEKEDIKQQEKNLFETSHDLCKDAMLEKIVLISVAYFCIATEMRFIIQKQKQQKSLQKKDSEMYHAKALHICSLFLPKECPLVQHITQSYNKNYLKDKPEFNLDKYLTEELGIDLSAEEDKPGSNLGTERANINERQQSARVEEKITYQEPQKSKRGTDCQAPLPKRNVKDIVEQELQGKQKQTINIRTQVIVPIQLQTSKNSNGSSGGKNGQNNDESNRLSSENGHDMDEGTSIVITDPPSSKPTKGNNRVKETFPVKKASINQIKKSPAISKVNQASFNSAKNFTGQNMHGANSFSKRGSHQTVSQPTLSVDRMAFNYRPHRAAQDHDGQHNDAAHGEATGPPKYKKQHAPGQMRMLHNQNSMPMNHHATSFSSQKSLHHTPMSAQKHHANQGGKSNINNRIVPISKVGLSLGQKSGMGHHSKGNNFTSQTRQPQAPLSTKHGVQRHYINLTEMDDKSTNSHGAGGAPKSKQSLRKGTVVESMQQQRLNTDGQIHGSQMGRASQRTAIATAQYLRQSQEAQSTDGMQSSPKQNKKKFEGLLNFFYKKE